MSNTTDKNEPAFPTHYSVSLDGMLMPGYATGMSLRDWFAGQALAGEMATQGYGDKGGWINDSALHKATAEKCYQIADAMLAERSKQ